MGEKKVKKAESEREGVADNENMTDENRPLDDGEAEKIVVAGNPSEWQHAHPPFEHWNS